MSIYDIIILGVIGLFAWIGYYKGLVMTVLRFVSWILSFILARILSPVLAAAIFQTDYFKMLNRSISQKLVELQGAGLESFAQSLQNPAGDKSREMIGDLLLEGIKSGKVIDSSNIIDFLSLSLTQTVVRIGSLIAVFLFISLVFGILLRFFKGIVSLPVIKQLDKSGGLVFGILEGIVIAYVVILILNMIELGGVAGEFKNSLLVKYFLNIELLKEGYLMVTEPTR